MIHPRLTQIRGVLESLEDMLSKIINGLHDDIRVENDDHCEYSLMLKSDNNSSQKNIGDVMEGACLILNSTIMKSQYDKTTIVTQNGPFNP